MMFDVDAHAYDEPRYEEHRACYEAALEEEKSEDEDEDELDDEEAA